jgi:hypothetical protein
MNITGSNWNHNPDWLNFSRTQSRELADREWESRASPLEGYAIEIARLLGIALAGCLLLVVLLAVTP